MRFLKGHAGISKRKELTEIAGLFLKLGLIVFGESFGPYILRDLDTYRFWSMAHEIRTDFAMWLGSLFLIIKGGGKWSFDRWFK